MYKIVVVGGGLAGLSAALEAVLLAPTNSRVQVTLLEKEPKLGGSSIKDAGGIRSVTGLMCLDTPIVLAH